MRILIVEDDKLLANALTRSLSQTGYAVDCVNTGEEANHILFSQTYDLLILDLGLPKLDGVEVLRRLRRRSTGIPVLILTAHDALRSRVEALDRGADDYMVKPFDLPELEARVRALIRRGHFGSSPRLTLGSLTLDTVGRRASINRRPIDLSAREICVLEALILRANRVVSKEQLAEHLSNWDAEISNNAVEVYVHRLRKKLESGGVIIRTIRGLGYLVDKPRDE